MRNEPERYEFQVPIRLTVKNRSVEVPLAVSVTAPQLAEIVARHLETGEEIHTGLLEAYADQVSAPAPPKRGRSRAGNGRPPEQPAGGEEASDGASSAERPARRRSRRDTEEAPSEPQ